MADKTVMEREAIRMARQSLYHALLEIGKAEVFNESSAGEMDFLIEKVWDGVRKAMQDMSVRGEIPF